MSSRTTVADLAVRHGIGQLLPALFHEDEFVQRWCAGLDDVVAPIPATLDSFWAYLDPALAPPDFVEWLATWVGLELDQTWTLERRRTLVGAAHRLHDARGTAGGLAELIELYTGVRPEIDDGVRTAWSATPGTALPGPDEPVLVVRLTLPVGSPVDRRRLEAMVAAGKPAHVPHRVEIEEIASDSATTVRETGPATADGEGDADARDETSDETGGDVPSDATTGDQASDDETDDRTGDDQTGDDQTGDDEGDGGVTS